jgi:glucose-1-phosphate adenylyltransferase
LKLDGDDRISAFIEKPQDHAVLGTYVSRDDQVLPYLGSMGIYVFKLAVLVDLLNSGLDDFGGDVIPAAIESLQVYGYTFQGYWQDIGTMHAFYEANLALTQSQPPFHFDDPVAPIFTRPRFLPGSRIYNVSLDRVTLADGCIIEGAEIQRSVIGIRSVIGEDVILRDSVMMGADYYEQESDDVPKGAPAMGLGRGSRIQGAIIDKNARIGAGVVIEPFPQGIDIDEPSWSVHDGIVIVPKNAILEQGMVIKPT